MSARSSKNPPVTFGAKWEAATTAPLDCDLEVCVVDEIGPCPWIFPCRLTGAGWINVHTGQNLAHRPSYWREWTGSRLDR